MAEHENNASQSQNRWKDRVATTKEGMDLLRQLLIVAIILLLLIWPSTIKGTLIKLGITKVNFGVAEFNVSQQAQEETGDAAQRLGEANKTVESVQQQIEALAQTTSDAKTRTGLERLNADLKQPLETIKTAEQNLNASLAAQNTIIQNATAEDVQDSGPWGIVISADKKLDPDAQDERDRAMSLGYKDAKIYFRQKWFRTVVGFPSLDNAQDALPKLRSIHSSCYLVNISKWCPTTKDEGNGVLQCTTP